MAAGKFRSCAEGTLRHRRLRMPNPWMRMWLNAVNSSLEATRAFWVEVLRPRQRGERDRPSDAPGARAAEEPKSTTPRPPEVRATDTAESSPTRPTTDELEQTGDKSSREPSGRASDASTGTSRSDASSEAKPRRPAEPSKVAKKRAPSQKTPKPQSSATRKAGEGNPKYRNPDDPSQTWSGRGRRPRWVTQALEGGRTLDDLQSGKS